MKVTLVLIGLLLSSVIDAQKPDSLICGSKKWYNHIYTYSMSVTTEVLACSYDTLINDTTYLKLLKGLHGIDPPTYSGGFIREQENRIYYRIKSNSPEVLVYDFNIVETDTVSVFNFLSLSNELEEISLICDSIRTEDYFEQPRITYYLSSLMASGLHTETWIEGIGSTSGLLHNSDGRVGGDAYHLGCVKQGEDFIYKREGVVACMNIALNVAESQKSNTRIYPNPVFVSDILYVDTNSEICVIELFNELGQKVYGQELVDNQSTIRINNPPGIYFYQLKNHKGNSIQSGKLVIISGR